MGGGKKGICAARRMRFEFLLLRCYVRSRYVISLRARAGLSFCSSVLSRAGCGKRMFVLDVCVQTVL